MFMTVFSVTLLALVFMKRFVVVVLLLQSKGSSRLLPGCHVEPVLLLQLPSGFVPLCFQLSQSPTDKILLLEVLKSVTEEA